MKFDKNRVYTAINADELKVGSKVIVADNIADLKNYVMRCDGSYTTKIEKIKPEQYQNRFGVLGESVEVYWSLAYLISEPDTLTCEDLKIGDIVSDGIVDFMVLGINRKGKSDKKSVYLPRIGWCDNENLANFYKKEQKDENN